MGYSHYWYRPVDLNEEVYKTIEEDVKKLKSVFQNKSIQVRYIEPMFEEGEVPKGKNRGILIKGTCETFVFPVSIPETYKKFFVSMKDGRMFQFVKTNHGRYDIGVQLALIIAKYHLKEDIIVTSDGDDWNWQEAKEIVQKHLDYGSEFRLDESPPFEEMGMEISWTIHEDRKEVKKSNKVE